MPWQRYKKQIIPNDMLNVVKIGGNVIDDEQAFVQFLDDFAAIRGFKILIHGGGKLATQIAEKLNISTQMIDGRRITDEETLKIVTMVYAGWINKNIVAKLLARNCTAIGLSGVDANVIPAIRRNPIPVDYGCVGDVNHRNVNVKMIQLLFEQNFTPVFSAITHDGKGGLLNSNADTIASSIAMSMCHIMPTRLIYCFEKNGVLSNPNDENSAISHINKELYEQYKGNGIISGGMIPKIDNAFNAIDAGVKEVVIKHAKNINIGGGTIIGEIQKED
ncbi:MAG: acetylglutamate kinase [Bacteroidales bacterium]